MSRVSRVQTDRGFVGSLWYFNVFVDGRLVLDVQTADEEEGFVEYGWLAKKIKRRVGDVKILWREFTAAEFTDRIEA